MIYANLTILVKMTKRTQNIILTTNTNIINRLIPPKYMIKLK